MQVTILGSGSGGNCAVVSSSRTRLLVDAGFSRREILRRLQAAGEDAENFDALLISHEHSDHVAGLRVLARKSSFPVFLNPLTRRALGTDAAELPRVEEFRSGEAFWIGDIEITPMTVPHDAADPVAFCFQAEGVKVAIVTDLGYMPENVKQQIRGAACLVMESNHDLEMLKVGPYPWSLKQRVLSRVGHLSNEGLGQFLANDFDGIASHLVLAHLSENNNLPQLAELCAQQALDARPARSTTSVQVAQQHAPLATLRY